jgi:hypothetical protein
MKSESLQRILMFAAMFCAGSGCATAGGPKDPCGLVSTVPDPFAGTMRGFNLYLDPGGYTAVGMEEAKGKYKLKVLVILNGSSKSAGAVGDKGEFAVGDKVLTFENQKDAQPVANSSSRGVFTQWILEYALTGEQATALIQAPLKGVKVNVGGESFQLALNDLQGLQVQNSATCMTK